MAHPFDLARLGADIVAAASGAVNEDISTISGFSRTQVDLMTKQAAWIAEAAALGEIDGELLDFFTRDLAESAKTFVKVLQGLSMIAIEKAWNAVIGVLWNAIGTAAGISLPIPKF